MFFAFILSFDLYKFSRNKKNFFKVIDLKEKTIFDQREIQSLIN
jgi:hypothetical protein